MDKAVDAAFSGMALSVSEQLGPALASRMESVGVTASDLQGLLRSLLDEVLPREFLTRMSSRHQRAALLALLSASEDAPDMADWSGKPATGGDMLTSEEGAALLHVSRTHFNKLVDAGKIAADKTEGGHRRVQRSEVLRYKADSQARRTAAIDRMQDASVRMGLYDDELAGIPVPPSR